MNRKEYEEELERNGYRKFKIKKGSKIYQDFDTKLYDENFFSKTNNTVNENTVFFCKNTVGTPKYECLTYGAGFSNIDGHESECYGCGGLCVSREFLIQYI